MNVAGKIYAEYWVDCWCCRNAVPCAETTLARAAEAAKKMGWTRFRGSWECPTCQVNKKS